MAYEIPQQLQHKEKIMFGLTLQQLGYAFLFGIITCIIIVKLDASMTVKFSLASIPALLGIVFVIFDIVGWSKNVIAYAQFRKATLMSPGMKKLIGIKAIKDDAVITDKKISILEVEPINFSIKPNDEKNIVISNFQKFLNSLDFPVQFVISTKTLSLQNYFDNCKVKDTFKSVFKDYRAYIESVIKDQEMRNRKFFVVIPERNDLEIQTSLCKERLSQVGLKVRRLKENEILKMLYDYFNDLDEKRDFEGDADNSLHYLIAPNFIENAIDYINVNKKFCRLVSAIGYPRMVESGFLDRIISSNGDFDISIHVEPFPIATMMVLLNKELQKQRADLYSDQTKGKINPTLEIKYKDTLKVLADLQKGNQKLFNVSLYVNCKGKSKEEINLLSKKVEAELNSIMVIPSIPIFRMSQGYESMLPLSRDVLKDKRNITTDALSAFFPFTSPYLSIDNKGVMLGLNKNNVPLIKDIFRLPNANGLVLATSGGGKSYFTKLLNSRQLMNGTKVMVVDPQGEYIALTKEYKGEVITISKDSSTIINPLDLMGHDFVEKRLSLMDLFRVMFEDLSEIQKAILDKALKETYEKKGITIDSWKGKTPPTFSDLYTVLSQMDKKASAMEKSTFRALLNRLAMYTKGGVFGFMDRQTKIDFHNDFVCFNIGNMPKQVKPVVMFLILDYVYMKMKQDKQRKLLVIDEAWSLLGKAEEASYIFEIVKTCRKFNLGLLLITQDVADLVSSKAGHAVLANSSYTFLLRQKPAVIDSVVKTFRLSEHEKNYLLTAELGSGILILGTEHQELKVIASPKEHEIITTNPEEVSKTEEAPQETKDVNINLNLDKPYYLKGKLTLEEGNYLLNHGYVLSMNVPINENRGSMFYVKLNKNNTDGPKHTFLVHNIANEIRKHTKHVEVNESSEADIIFKDKKGNEVAIEVETGLGFDKHRKRFQEKIFSLDRKFKNMWHLVLTNKDYKHKYQIFGREMLLRKDICRLITAYFPARDRHIFRAKSKAEKRPVKRKKARTRPVAKT
jgi:hypothetical protein